MEAILRRSDELYRAETCCHSGTPRCDCMKCWSEKFREAPDDYICFKSLCWYTMKYGPSFASEFFHYLSMSKLIETFLALGKKRLYVLSLGCGLGPDLIALNRYVESNQPGVRVRYLGIDKQAAWGKIRIPTGNAEFDCKDALTGLDLSRYDIVILNKLISTLKRNDKVEEFTALLTSAIKASLRSDCCLVYIDVNSYYTGRDDFHRSVSPLFMSVRQFYFDDPPFFDKSWTKLPESHVVFGVPQGISISPLMYVGKDVIFEYWK
jgi:hypothetical protein